MGEDRYSSVDRELPCAFFIDLLLLWVHYASGTRCGVLQLDFVLSWALARI